MLPVSAGYFPLFAPRRVGGHVDHFGGICDEFGFSIDATDRIHVVLESSSVDLVGAGTIGLAACVHRWRIGRLP